METKVECKDNDLISILTNYFGKSINLARIKFINHFVLALCKVQNVTFEKLANAFETSTKSESSHRRIQRFIADYVFNADIIAKLIFNLLPNNEKVMITIDRTNWKFGETDINIFMLGIVYKGVAFPLLFKMLKKRGNSNSDERIRLIKRFIRLFGKECIEALMADREFVGKKWLNYLKKEKIRYYIRVRNNFQVFIPHKNKKIQASLLFSQLGVNQFYFYPKIVKINESYCYVSGCKLKDDFLIIASLDKPDQSLEYYKQRWQIEVCFKALKSSGFNIENTHLQDIQRIKKLLLLVMIAFVWCYKVGIFLHQNKPIKIKKHGRKAKSIFKYGLDFVASVLLNPKNQTDMNIFQFLSCT